MPLVLPYHNGPILSGQTNVTKLYVIFYGAFFQAPALRYAPPPAIPGSPAAQGAREHPHRGKMVGDHQRLPGCLRLIPAVRFRTRCTLEAWS